MPDESVKMNEALLAQNLSAGPGVARNQNWGPPRSVAPRGAQQAESLSGHHQQVISANLSLSRASFSLSQLLRSFSRESSLKVRGDISRPPLGRSAGCYFTLLSCGPPGSPAVLVGGLYLRTVTVSHAGGCRLGTAS